MAFTDDMAHRLAAFLAPTLPGFRYTRTRTQLRKPAGAFVDDLIISITAWGGTSYWIDFYIGVQHTEVETLLAELREQKVGPYSRTIAIYTPNVQNQQVLPWTEPSSWRDLSRDEDFAVIGPEIQRFITEFALPYHARFHDLRAIRHSLATRDGMTVGAAPLTVLAIDALLSDVHHAEEYLPSLQEDVDTKRYQHNCEQFNDFYPRLAARYPMLPPFTLRPRQR